MHYIGSTFDQKIKEHCIAVVVKAAAVGAGGDSKYCIHGSDAKNVVGSSVWFVVLVSCTRVHHN